MHRSRGWVGGARFDGVLNLLSQKNCLPINPTSKHMTAVQLDVLEIQGRTAQGMQEPFQCIASDGNLYYVKGRQTDRASLCHEWICAHLARELGLPLPPFGLLNVSQELLLEAPAEWKVLGEGPAFGSQLHPGCAWLNLAQIRHISLEKQLEIFAFDWWIQNIDRTDGNPNLLWDPTQEELVVIDHNLAFDPTLNPAMFLEHHIFRGCWDHADLVMRDMLQARFCAASDAVLRRACQNIPPEWSWNNPECDIPANIDLDAINTTLARCQSSDFWRFA